MPSASEVIQMIMDCEISDQEAEVHFERIGKEMAEPRICRDKEFQKLIGRVDEGKYGPVGVIPLIAHSKISGCDDASSKANNSLDDEDEAEEDYVNNMLACASKHLIGDQKTKENLKVEGESYTNENKSVDQSQGNNRLGRVTKTIDMEEIEREAQEITNDFEQEGAPEKSIPGVE